MSVGGRGRGRGRGRPIAMLDDLPVVGAEAGLPVESPAKPTESTFAGPQPQRRGRGKALLQDVLQTAGCALKPSEPLKLDVLSSTLTPPDEHIADTGERRVIEATADNIVISINNTDSAAVTPAASVSLKPPKIGSGRLGKMETGSSRKLGGKRGKGQSERSTAAEEPVTIGIAVIRTPADQREVQYTPFDQSPKPKGILKRTQSERTDDWVEETVETLDWDKEIKEAQRRKVEMSDKSSAADEVVKDMGAVKPDDNIIAATAVVDDDDDDDMWEDVEDDDEDLHDISAESFDQFIRENTLKLDIALATPDVSEWTTKDPSGSITAGSQDSFLKTPVGQTRVVDWGAEMDQLSQSEKLRMSVEQGE